MIVVKYSSKWVALTRVCVCVCVGVARHQLPGPGAVCSLTEPHWGPLGPLPTHTDRHAGRTPSLHVYHPSFLPVSHPSLTPSLSSDTHHRLWQYCDKWHHTLSLWQCYGILWTALRQHIVTSYTVTSETMDHTWTTTNHTWIHPSVLNKKL